VSLGGAGAGGSQALEAAAFGGGGGTTNKKGWRMSDTYRNESRREFRREGIALATIDDLTLGCLQRIADAVEKMCGDREKLERGLKWERESNECRRETIAELQRSNAALRGVITKLKRGKYEKA
jgi:UrcA family protein